MLQDITKLPDITADESNQLSELCRMLNALEGLFVEGPDQVLLFLIYETSVDVGKIDFGGGIIRSFLAQILISLRSSRGFHGGHHLPIRGRSPCGFRG